MRDMFQEPRLKSWQVPEPSRRHLGKIMRLQVKIRDLWWTQLKEYIRMRCSCSKGAELINDSWMLLRMQTKAIFCLWRSGYVQDSMILRVGGNTAICKLASLVCYTAGQRWWWGRRARKAETKEVSQVQAEKRHTSVVLTIHVLDLYDYRLPLCHRCKNPSNRNWNSSQFASLLLCLCVLLHVDYITLGDFSRRDVLIHFHAWNSQRGCLHLAQMPHKRCSLQQSKWSRAKIWKMRQYESDRQDSLFERKEALKLVHTKR